MWLILARPPHPDAPLWPGRRWLAVADAIAWPAAWIAAAAHAPFSLGVVGPLLVAFAAWQVVKRLHRAIAMNHRYRFTTWRWGKAVAASLFVGLMLKLSVGL
jgi:hypothetical protein